MGNCIVYSFGGGGFGGNLYGERYSLQLWGCGVEGKLDGELYSSQLWGREARWGTV